MSLTREDFFCGAFLSYLLNNRIVPAIFEERIDPNRKIYDFTTNKGDFRVYVKSSEKPVNESSQKNGCRWNFPFTENQIDELKSVKSEGRQMYFAFVCGKTALNKSKIAIIPESIIFKYIDIDRNNKYKGQSIKIKLVKGHWDFDVYGTARSDKVDGLDNTLKVRVKNIDELFGQEQTA
ncbi:hypothetical protein [Paenibacillus crassostreae]|uniref:Uncharacterized protein n=1 Tax=Paenibacillus crassostreae TaxID=1763538 RepID=A0A167AUA6_9BACL|nr:hypothetical protein [Paenibacillus crassostreae]AOZ93608.1 hypothetical protein LPB68_16365 [Paenibacillus crassostreae]OAB71435.1 hypothetical protein PNBC_19235 [Paenibacillus crassostreae]